MSRSCIRLATAADAAAVEALRVDAYRASADFRIPDEAFLEELRWSSADDAASVLTVWCEGELVATMRGEWIDRSEDAPPFFSGMTPPARHLDWPAPILTRAATRANHRTSGLNALMRFYFVRAAMKAGVRRLYGYVPAGGARTRLMGTLGYAFRARTDRDPTTPSARGWMMAWLDLPVHGRSALTVLENLVREDASRFPWEGRPLRLVSRPAQPDILVAGTRRRHP